MSLVNPVILQLPLSGHVLAVVCPDVAALVHLFKADWDVVENHRLAVEDFLLKLLLVLGHGVEHVLHGWVLVEFVPLLDGKAVILWGIFPHDNLIAERLGTEAGTAFEKARYIVVLDDALLELLEDVCGLVLP